MCTAVLPCCPDSHATLTPEAVGKLLVPATQHGTGCGVRFLKESGAGVAGAGCDGAARAADAVSAAPPWRSAVVGRVHGQRTRERLDERRLPSSARRRITGGGYLLSTFLLDAEAGPTPRLGYVLVNGRRPGVYSVFSRACVLLMPVGYAKEVKSPDIGDVTCIVGPQFPHLQVWPIEICA